MNGLRRDDAVHGASAPPSRAAKRFAGSRVLVVDDIETNRDLLRRRLARLGVTHVVEAEDGAKALEIIGSCELDLVLLDIMMPVMTGFDVLERLAQDGLTERLPVIVISAMSEMDSTVRAIELGAEDFLLKPFDPTLLRARVSAVLEKKLLRDQIRAELAAKQAELAEARQLQLALTPPPMSGDGLRIDVVLEPAREVGGDLVDHIALPDGRHLVALGDVSGKGAGPALMMARCYSLIRSLSARADASVLFGDLGAAADAVNAELAARNPRCMFVTLLLAVFDPRTGRLDYVRCGHVPPFVRRADGRIERLDGTRSLPVGLDEDARYRAQTTDLAAGDVLLVLSDGVTEAAAPDGVLFGDAGVKAWLAAPQISLASLVDQVRVFEGAFPAADDLSAILLAVGPSPRPGAASR
jgi:sigma-B regulation protein RsbU (phosphoserine phosphatase)